MSDRDYFPGPEENFNNILPRTIFAEADPERLDRKGTTFTGDQAFSNLGGGTLINQIAGYGAGNNILRNPSRRFYDPEITTTAIYLPRTIKQKNRWCRWFYDHDELIGASMDVHAELPYSKAVLDVDDPSILRHFEDCIELTNFYSKLSPIDLEFMKIGEVFIHNNWDDSSGMWNHITVHNPDYVEVRFTPFADQECAIELIPDDELKALVHSTKPEDQQLKSRIPDQIFRKVLTGKNITLDPDEVTHIARRSHAYDIRGTSIINRIFRLLMYEDKLREAQITIADNFIYPLKIFKLGDPQKGWIPNETHQRALASMLQQATFDPNFSLIYHYGLNVEYVTVADKVMRLEKEWTDITEKKMIALGVSKEFLSGSSTYAAANVGLQIQLARYKAKRDLFEYNWIRNKFFKIMAERNDFYRRDKKELVGNYRVSRKGRERQERLIIPNLIWDKKLMLRDDQAFLTFMNNVYAQGKGPISAITLLQLMGLSLDDELKNKRKQEELEEKIGAFIHPIISPGGSPATGVTAKIKSKLKFGKKDEEKQSFEKLSEADKEIAKKLAESEAKHFTKDATEIEEKTIIKPKELERKEEAQDLKISEAIQPVDSDVWFSNMETPNIPSEVKFLLIGLNNKLESINKKYNGDFKIGLNSEIDDISKNLKDLYIQGRLFSYGVTEFYPTYRQFYAMNDNITDYSDLILFGEFENWLKSFVDSDSMSKQAVFNHIRNLGNTCFCYGQLKGYQEQGIFTVRVSNVLANDGLRYTINDLLSKSRNLSSLVSPKDEIVVLYPCIEGFDDEEFGHNVDPQIQRYKDLRCANIDVKNCPIEYAQSMTRILNKIGKFLKSKYSTIIFVKDIVDLDVWEETQKAQLEKKHEGIEDLSAKNFFINNAINYEKLQKKGNIPTLEHNKVLYLANWIGMEEYPLTENFLRCINIVNNENEKAIRKAFKRNNCDLTSEEIETYKIFKYIEPLSADETNPRGYKISNYASKNLETDYKLRQGKIWDLNGKCLNNIQTDELQIFRDNLRLWIDYPHLLNKELEKAFDGI
jgi:hypothetical protein